MIDTTPTAVAQLREMLASRGLADTHGLRLAVEKGGCAGLQYSMKIDLPAEGDTVYLYNTELFQSVNPLWVILLTPVVVAFFAWLKRRGREPNTATKIAWGLLVSALSTLVMVAAVYVCHNGEMKASAWWLVACYGVVTIGELFLSPMGLSLVSKVSPKRLTALMMGGWFLSTSIGNKLSGILATLWDGYAHKSSFFLVNFALLGAAAVALFLMLRWLNKTIAEH